MHYSLTKAISKTPQTLARIQMYGQNQIFNNEQIGFEGHPHEQIEFAE